MKTSTLEQRDFDALLSWLSPDREEAGKKYEEIRDGIIRFFYFKGVTNPEDLADETISRVAAKVVTFNQSKKIKTITYFLGFAVNVLREHTRNFKREFVPLDAVQLVQALDEVFKVEGDDRIEILRGCLKKISPEEAELLYEYYSEEGTEKIKIRKQLAREYDCEMTVLSVRVHRLKTRIGNCIKQVLKKKL